MEDRIQALVGIANNKLSTADHLAYTTYPTVREPKLLLSIIEDIFVGVSAGMDAILLYERMFKRVPPHTSDLMTRIDVFKTKCAERYNFNREVMVMLIDIQRLLEFNRKSAMQIAKRDKLVIFEDDYRMKSITIESVKNYLTLSKPFIEKVNKVLVNVGRY